MSKHTHCRYVLAFWQQSSLELKLLLYLEVSHGSSFEFWVPATIFDQNIKGKRESQPSVNVPSHRGSKHEQVWECQRYTAMGHVCKVNTQEGGTNSTLELGGRSPGNAQEKMPEPASAARLTCGQERHRG